MLRPLQRPIALILLPLSLYYSTGCTSVKPVPAVEAQPPTEDSIEGVTTLAGIGYDFDSAAAIRGDTVYATVEARPMAIPVDSVQRWWLRRTDVGKSVFAVLGVAAGVVLVAAVIAAATKESCPFVYSWDGTRYVFEAEPYGGAVTRGLERDDFGVLPTLRSEGGAYRLLVTNEVNETQMTNLFSLWAVDHAPGLRVVPDEWGGLHTLSRPLPPSAAVDRTGKDLLHWLSADDRRIWEPLPLADSAGGLRDEVVLTFPRPAGATRAKLVSRTGTALWGSHMIRAMLELRGTAVEDWYAQVDADSLAADSVRTWAVREELYGLLLQVEEPDGWQVRGILPGSGPFLAAERVVPLDLSKVRGDSVRIRIRPPRGFWALNYFAIDYSREPAAHGGHHRSQLGVRSRGAGGGHHRGHALPRHAQYRRPRHARVPRPAGTAWQRAHRRAPQPRLVPPASHPGRSAGHRDGAAHCRGARRRGRVLREPVPAVADGHAASAIGTGRACVTSGSTASSIWSPACAPPGSRRLHLRRTSSMPISPATPCSRASICSRGWPRPLVC